MDTAICDIFHCSLIKEFFFIYIIGSIYPFFLTIETIFCQYTFITLLTQVNNNILTPLIYWRINGITLIYELLFELE